MRHRRTTPIRKQRGAATLLMAIVILFLITFTVLGASRTSIFEQKTSANAMRYTTAFEAAQGGTNYAIAWLSTTGNASSTAFSSGWASDASNPPNDQKNTTSIAAQTFGGYTANVTLWRNSAYPKLIEIDSTATGEATSTVKVSVNVLTLQFAVPQAAPLIINGCLGGVTGNPSVGADGNGESVVAKGDPSCLLPGHLSVAGSMTGNAFADSWSYVFGSMTKADMAALANAQPGGPTSGPIYYYDASTTPTTFHASLGSATSPVIIVFDTDSSTPCPKINGGATIFGIIYCGGGLDMQGWGGTTIFGSMITGNDVTKFTANASIQPNGTNSTSAYSAGAVVSKVTGSWRDF
jgi:Tfp pilus assembly protein PilX